MVPFGSYYSLDVNNIESVEKLGQNNSEYPFLLRVTFNSGRSLSISYTTENARDNEYSLLIRRIEQEIRWQKQHVYNQTVLILDTVRRIDKRQLRIWRQLAKLLQNVEVESDG